jgi:hypothetical protein
MKYYKVSLSTMTPRKQGTYIFTEENGNYKFLKSYDNDNLKFEPFENITQKAFELIEIEFIRHERDKQSAGFYGGFI